MRFILNMLLVAVLAASILTACQNASTTGGQQQQQQTSATAPKNAATSKTDEHGHAADDEPRITLADAKKDFDAGTAVFVDTRAIVAYDQEHIKGSINVPAEAMETRYKEIPTDKKIIAYCS